MPPWFYELKLKTASSGFVFCFFGHQYFIVQLFPARYVWVLSIMKQQSNIKDTTASGSESSVNTDLKL